jgi:hypothetical protein
MDIFNANWPGTGWGTFIIFFGLAFTLMVWVSVHNNDRQIEKGVSQVAAEHAPVDAVDRFMQSYTSQGYVVEHTKDLVQDETNFQRLIIEYVVYKFDRSESWTYTWAWEAPVALSTNLAVSDEPGLLDRLLSQCRLIPLTDAAISVQPTLDQYIAETGN